MLDMLRRSAGDCWFVTLLSSSKESQSQPLELLEDDFRFFEGRLGFMSITRHGLALEKWHLGIQKPIGFGGLYPILKES